MKFFLYSICTISLLAISHVGFSQRAKNGDFTVSTANNVLNSYTYLTADASAGANTLTVASNAMTGGFFGSPLAPGDLILIIQMQGAQMNCNITPAVPAPAGWGGDYTVPDPYLWSFDWYHHIENWGEMVAPYGNYLNAGKFEKVEVMSVSGGNAIQLQCALQNSYTASGHVQIVRIPRFNNLTVSGGPSAIIPTLWNGQTGGVVAIEVENVLDLNAGSTISASGFGFRGGQLDPFGASGNPLTPDEVRYLGTPNPAGGSEKGEGIAGYITEYEALYSRYGIGAPANGGGGGGFQNAGGGGGSNVYMGATAYTGNGVPDPTYNVSWSLDLSGPPLATPVPINGTITPGGGRGGYALADKVPPGIPSPLTTGPRNSNWAGDARKTNGGRGGHPLTYDPTRLFFGGGGGAGDQDSGNGGAGGRGGGLVYIVNYGSIIGGGTIEVNGQAGQNSNPTNAAPTGGNPIRGNDGAGGGGAGGSIFIENATPIPASINLMAVGGDGGDQNILLLSPTFQNDECAGPGGSGTGGSIAYTAGAPSSNVNAGANGVVTSNHTSPMMADFPPNGATAGHAGVAGLPAPYFDIIAIDDTVCSGGSTTLTVSTLGSFPAGTNASMISWYDQPFNGHLATPLTTGLSFTTPNLTSTTTYYVALCPNSFRIPVTVVVIPGANLLVTDPAPVCEPLTVDITLPAITAGSDPGTLTYWSDAGATVSLSSPNAVNATGTYYIQLDAGGGCVTVEPVNVVVDPQEDASFDLTANCFGATANVTGTPGGLFTFNPAPGDGAIIDPSSGEITNGTLGNTYFVQYTTPGVCADDSIQTVVAATDLAYSPTVTDENCGAGDGTITLVASGGSGAPYQYSITGGAPYNGTGVFSGLSSGTYAISILDNTGCEITGSEFVGAIGGPTIDSLIVSSPSCPGVCDAAITAYVSGGTAPYTYTWYDNLGNVIGTNDSILTGMCAGIYSVEVSDAGGSTVFYFNEDFGTDGVACTSQGTLANTYNSGVGVWNTTSTGVNAAESNLWYVSTMEAGVGAGNCGTGCGVATGLTDRTLHISNQAVALLGLAADEGAVYNAGGLCPTFFCVETDTRVESPAINLGGTAMTLTFDYIHQGDGTDQCEFWYFDGVAWVNGGLLPNTAVGACAGGQHEWAQYSWPIPPALNGVTNFRVGFRWSNNDEGVGSDPSVAIDNIQISEGGSACPAVAAISVVDPPAPVLITTNPSSVCEPSTVDITLPAVTAGSDAGTLTYWQDNSATTILATPDSISTSGWYYIQLDVSGCNVMDSVYVSIDPLDDASFSYALATYCQNGTDPTPVISGLPGGQFTSSPVGLSIDPGTGIIDLSSSAPNTYTITYTTTGACPNSSDVTISITGLDDASFSYSALAFCQDATDPSPTITGVTGGTFTSAPAGLSIDLNTGTIDVSASAVNTYTVTYSTVGACANSSDVTVTINPVDDAGFTYSLPSYCANGVDPSPTITGASGGTFTSTPVGLSINTSTGLIDLSASTPNTYTVTYTTAGICPNSSDVTVTINPVDDASFSYSAAAFCQDATDPVPTISGLSGGTFTSAPAGLTMNASTGEIDVSASTPNTYTITYTTNGSCPTTSDVTVTIQALDDASFAYASTAYCADELDPIPTISGLTGGSFSSSPAGLSINTSTGEIDLSLSTANSYTVTYTTAGACPNSSDFTVTVNSLPVLIVSDPSAVCSPDSVDLTASSITAGSDPGTLTYWTNSAATVPLSTPTSVTATGTYYIQLDNGSCSVVEPVNVVVTSSPNLVITDPAPVCAPSTVDLTNPAVTTGSDNGTLTYWIDAGATVPLNDSTSVSATGVYYIQLDLGGCSVIEAVNVTVNPQPNLVVTDPIAVCEPSFVDITDSLVTAGSDTGTLTYWTDANATNVLSNPNSVGTGTYYIQLEGANGCESIVAVNAVVNPLDDATFDMESICEGGVVVSTATPGGTFAFGIATSATIDAQTGTVSNATVGNSYSVTYTTNGMCPSSFTVTFIAGECPDEPADQIVVPTAFTPDGDLINDTWQILNLDDVSPNNTVRVYNRWGNLIFEFSADAANPYMSNAWDGTYKGERLPVGSYFYVIDLHDIDQQETGAVSIIMN